MADPSPPAGRNVEAPQAPPIPLDNMWSFVIAQLKTQGHFQGEGECEIDGSSP